MMGFGAVGFMLFGFFCAGASGAEQEKEIMGKQGKLSFGLGLLALLSLTAALICAARSGGAL